MKTVNIYYLQDPRHFLDGYIGKTNNIKKRLNSHYLKAKTNPTNIKLCWIKSLFNKGMEPIVRILDIVPENLWKEYEKSWIQLFRFQGFNLKNMTDGGEGGKMTTESIEKLKRTLSTPEHKEKMNKVWTSLEYQKKRQLLSCGKNNNFFGKTHTPESKEKISENRKGKGSKLNNEAVKVILYFKGVFGYGQKLAKLYKVTPDHISRIQNNKTNWRWA